MICELTPRQSEILKWLSYGKSRKEIAEIMGIPSEGAVEQHIVKIKDLLNVPNSTSAVAQALRLGILK